jgi:hypothetical protein
MIYVYAITDRPQTAALPGTGIGGSRLLSVAYQDVAAVISSFSRVEVAPTAENVWRHEEIVEQLMAGGAVLPVRFGTVLADKAAAQAMLAARYPRFLANLDRVRGRVELGLRVLWQNEDCHVQQKGKTKEESSGRAYMLARAEEERRAQACRERGETLAAKLDRAVASLAVEGCHQILLAPRLLLTAAYLVEQRQVGAFQREVQAFSSAYPALRVVCTGPWPPYSFVGAGLTATEERGR